MSTNGRAVLITGACGDIGRSLCAVFSADGYHVIATDRDRQADDCRCDAFVGADLAQVVLDNGYREKFAAEVHAAVSGRSLKCLVNNAAVQILSGFDDLALEDFRQSLDINVSAPMLLAQLFLGELEKAQGSVVNIGSIHARLTKPAFVSYAVSKAALEGLTRSLAVDLGARVRVNAIRPAAVETGMLLAGFSGARDMYPSLKACHPARRLAVPEEIARAALFLASDDCRFMTGTVMGVDGGIGARLHDPE